MAFEKRYKDIAVQVNTGKIRTVCDNIENDTQLNTLTGLRNIRLLEVIQELITKSVTERRVRKLSLPERIILTFIKLKHNVVLSFLFGNITSEICKAIFCETISVLSKVLDCAVPFLTKQEVKSHMPQCFNNFRDVRIVVDCIEVPVQKAKCLCCRVRSYSHYKGTHTIKFMTGVSPSGLITFVSRMYGGRTSDKAIFQQSQLIEKLDVGDAIMADKGFLIEELCEETGIKLIRPLFLRKKSNYLPQKQY